MTYDNNINNQTICIDIGNSRMKIFDGNKLIKSISNKVDLEIELMNYLCNSMPEKVIYSSVNKASENILKDVLFRLKIKYLSANELINKFTDIDFSNVPAMGIDRRLGLIAAYTTAKCPLITVDFGTCITINVIDEKAICLGGNIYPGLQTQANALYYYTGALPQLRISYTDEIIGKETNIAMQSAIIDISLEGLNAHILKIKKKYFENKEVNIIFTGGISVISKLHKYDFKYKVDELLVLKGMWVLSKYFFDSDEA